MKKSLKVAFGGIISAFSVILILLGNIPFGEYLGPTCAGLVLVWAVEELGELTSLGIYLASSVLAFFLSGNKEPALLYILFFGYFPILRDFLIKKVKIKALSWVIKFLVFNCTMVIAYFILIYVFGMPLEELQGLGKYGVYILLASGNVLLVVLDFCIGKLLILYRNKWQKRVHSIMKKK